MFIPGSREIRRLLCVGAHSDDIEIGAGATVARLIRENPGLRVTWVVLSAEGVRGDEARASAARYLGRGDHDARFAAFRDSHFPAQWAEVKAYVAELRETAPDLVLSHHGGDAHQDHRLVSELVWNTFRDHLVLEYEIPKFDGGLGSPNVFFAASKAATDAKIAGLRADFASQAGKHWFDDLTFRGLMRLRGLECCAPDGFAEAFYGRKVRLG
jgi:LmbE family N-acetylglucosaminyl deacetylase